MGNHLLSNVSHDQLLSHDLEEQCRVNSNSMINLGLIFVSYVSFLYMCFYIFFILIFNSIILKPPPFIFVTCIYFYSLFYFCK
ncbi:hypothetical protein RchiOBHm_Chr2g0133841 [Rosa chinensis]|uniref:Uncharacterized protein n=1 Tax=Rosa chinensis TaxID=74649 RepID=A0A2P6RVN9_ROSCH|nr:hypothetical protein RchiOBHm_Chr2g0133841 [Rosa chinensis]